MIIYLMKSISILNKKNFSIYSYLCLVLEKINKSYMQLQTLLSMYINSFLEKKIVFESFV